MRYRLLAAEDEPQLRMMLWDYFTAKDFDVTTCGMGRRRWLSWRSRRLISCFSIL